jgi:ligand-binding sensor domain-containing protein
MFPGKYLSSSLNKYFPTVKSWYITTLFIVVSTVIPRLTATPHYTAINYERNNGFPGNTIYNIYQDRQGYIWIGTDNGLVVFNGYEFKTYTTKDGLPDNEVFSINEDNTGRLWISMFVNEICYIWKGKIYTPDNDSLLHKLPLHSLPTNIEFDRWGNTWITQDTPSVVFINSKEEVQQIGHIGKDKFEGGIQVTMTADRIPILLNIVNAYRYNKDHFEFIGRIPGGAGYASQAKFNLAAIREISWTPFERFVKKLAAGNSIYWEAAELPTMIFFKKLSPNILGIGTKHGAYLRNIETGKVVDSFLGNYRVSVCMIARDSSLWFGTFGNGIFHFSRSFIRSIPIGLDSNNIRFVKAQYDTLHIISGESTLAEVHFNVHKQPEVISKKILNGYHMGNIYPYIGKDHQNNWITCEISILKYSEIGSKPIQEYVGACKAVIEEGDTNLLIGTTRGVFRLNKDRFIITDTLLFDKRITSLAETDGTVYAGTLTGLIVCYPDKRPVYLLKQNSLLNRHIVALCADNTNGRVWVANNSAMLIGLYKNGVITVINEDKGLECNSISTLAVDSSFLWVGTDKGLFVFNKDSPYNIIRHLSAADGLKSNQITYLEIADGRAYIGTDKGLNYFEVSEIRPLISSPKFIIRSIQDGETTVTSEKVITLKNKTLKISFDVIDHSGIARPKYSYRLKDGDWIDIDNSELYFPTIPYGDFTVQIKARSPNWKAPQTMVLSFHRAYPYYLRNWFVFLAGAVLMLIIGLLVQMVFRKRHKKEQEQLLLQRNLLNLEQMALQGQMNPHFIFNCITAIRQYYNKGNTEKANKFVDDFSTLIRTTFEMSTQTFTPLEKELAYLTQYLEIEKERFNHSFSFSVSKHIESPETSVFVPTMLLQPFVENAVRHGVRHLPDGKGKIDISIVQQQENIIITIQDNGLGRLKTLQMKQTSFTAAPVTSTKVNKKRIDILNKLFDQKVALNTSDVLDDKGEVAGTIVVISYPSDIYVSK